MAQAPPPPPLDGGQREDAALIVAAAAAAIYAAAELALIAALAVAVRRALLARFPAANSTGRLHLEIARILAGAERRLFAAVRKAGIDPGAHLPPVPGGPPAPPLGQLIEAVSLRVYRDTSDVYRQAVQDAIGATRGGQAGSALSLSRIQAAQKALDQLAEQGITGFTDQAGRNWDLLAYVEMATRTAVSNAYDNMQHAALIRGGVDLVLAYSLSTEGSCPLCLPWLGKVLSLTGATTGPVAITTAQGRPWRGVVAGTLAEAHAAGFRHPSCRCSTLPLADGADLSYAEFFAEPPGQSAETYAASQRQRALERHVRFAARAASAAISPEARARARRDLATATRLSREHREHHGLRQTQVGVHRREHPTAAH